MLLTRQNFIDEINAAPLKPETKWHLKYAMAAYIDICAGKENFLAATSPTMSLKQIKEFQNDMNSDAIISCAITLDKYELLHFMCDENSKVFLKQWTEEDIDLFEKAQTLSLTGHRAGSYHRNSVDYGMRHPAVYPSFTEPSRFLIHKTTSDRNGINLFVKDPRGFLNTYPKDGEYRVINVNPGMSIFEYWPAVEPVRNLDGTRTVPW